MRCPWVNAHTCRRQPWNGWRPCRPCRAVRGDLPTGGELSLPGPPSAFRLR
ncbi:hypothetical protein T261_8395 [Streptomyces lydicus]|nr:hypothetical protein T261_8395 [Streptomyces lydicus]